MLVHLIIKSEASTLINLHSILPLILVEYIDEPWHGISKNVICATSETPDEPAHTRILIRPFASRLSILRLLSY